MAEWFFKKKSKGEVECDFCHVVYFSNRNLAEIANQWKDSAK